MEEVRNMKISKENISLVSGLLKSAIDGKLEMNELAKAWPFKKGSSDSLDVLYEDLEEGVTHTPGFIMSGKIDLKGWHQQYEYAALVCDSLLMPIIETPERWMNIREDVLEGQDDYSEETIKKLVQKVLSEK
jgi:hypothetical protein